MLSAERIKELEAFCDRSDEGLETRIQENEGKVRIEWWDGELDRPRGQYFFDLDPDNHTVTFHIFNFDLDYRGTGYSRANNAFLPDWLRKVKCPRMVIPVFVNHDYHDHLIDSGFEEDEDTLIVTADVSDPNSRLDQYNAWVSGKGREPKWHTELPDKYRLTTVVQP